MKKSLIALAGLVAAGSAFAQSSVTLYGIADIWVGKPNQSYDAATGKISKQKFQAGSGGVNTSRWGLKGEEDLGGGLKATFNFESRINLANGATNAKMFDRQANVGMTSGLGTLKVGRSFTALDDMYAAANSGFDSALSANGVWLNSYTDAADAQLYYATPSMGGFAAAFSTQLSGNTAAKTTAFNVTYTGGPLYVGLGFEDSKAGAQKGTMVNASYDLGMAKLLGSMYTTKPTAGAKITSYQLGADIPVTGAITVSVGYASSKPSGSKANNAFGVAAAYSLSKRTTVYAGLRNVAAKQVNFNTYRAVDTDLYAIGVNHKF